jgi:hypothetical protein
MEKVLLTGVMNPMKMLTIMHNEFTSVGVEIVSRTETSKNGKGSQVQEQSSTDKSFLFSVNL